MALSRRRSWCVQHAWLGACLQLALDFGFGAVRGPCLVSLQWGVPGPLPLWLAQRGEHASRVRVPKHTTNAQDFGQMGGRGMTNEVWGCAPTCSIRHPQLT